MMTHAFWSGGGDAYLKGLEDYYAPRLAELRDRRRACTEDAEREALEREIQSVEQDYTMKRVGIERLLF